MTAIRKLFFIIFLSSTLFGAKLPEIGPSDVKETLKEIMDAHVSHKELTTPLCKRALAKYLEELDPTKTYFIESELTAWLSPSEEVLQGVLEGIARDNFSLFERIDEAMEKAIGRRNRIEKEISKAHLPEEVTAKEFKDLPWPASEAALKTRLIRIKALQSKTAAKVAPDSQEKVLKRLKKRRLNHEKKVTQKNSVQRERARLARILKAFASSFDSHTAYFTPWEASQFLIQVQQRLFGIGAQLRDDLNGFTVVKIIEGGPAFRNGKLKVNDRAIAINHEPIVGMEITDAVELIRGGQGTPVVLTVLRETGEGKEEAIDIEIMRGEVVIKEARIESKTIPFADGIIAHISLYAFYQDPLHSSASDLYEEISKLNKEHNVKGIILDLRNNSGGVLPQAVAVTGLFITKGIVVSIKDNKGRVESLRDIDGKTAWDGPLLVLTSKASASAAEIVAQTLQDYGRALIVGDEHTYGKGSFQTFTLDAGKNAEVNPKGEFKVTRGRYYTVSGKSPQLEGVKPDIVAPGLYSALEIGERHSKFPLETDAIPENFHDDLSDIPVVQRDQISWLYRFNLQQRLKTYTAHLPKLRENSQARLEKDPLYQIFLEALENDQESTIEVCAKGDLQLKEATNVMKDLILLLQ